MRLGDLYQASTIWKQLLEEASPGARGGILLHLGICFYAVGQLSTAYEFFQRAKEEGDDRADRYLEKIRRRRRAPGEPSGRPSESRNQMVTGEVEGEKKVEPRRPSGAKD